MRQRYYNPEIKRFVNQDILTGSLSDSQSLNRYSYVQGNPVSYTDPFGLSPIKSMFMNGNVVHSILGLAGNIPGIGIVASLIDAGLYFGEGNMVMFGACLVDAALGFVPFGAGYLIKMGSKSVRLLNVVIKGSKLARNSIDFYRNTKNFVFSAADFYIRHEGTFFTNDFKWGLADVGDIMSMAMSGTGMLQSGAGIYKSVTDLSAFLYASGIKADIKNALGRLKNGIKNTVGSEWNRFRNDNRGRVDLDALAGGFGIKGKSDVPYYFRGTTEGYPGNASVQRLGVTPTSTDPVIATIFATNGEQYGKGILYIANTTDLKGVPIVSSNVLSSLENEVVFGIQPIGFANKASVGISASQAREILGNMGYDIPSSIMRGDISNIISSVPRLKPNEIISFVKMAGGM